MKIAVTAKHFDLEPDLSSYIMKKLNKLDRYVPKFARKSVHAEVILDELSGKQTNRYQCEFIIHLPREPIIIKEATVNIFAAVDIVEAKVKNQLLRYKEKSVEHAPWRHRIWRRLRIRGGA